MQISVPKFLHLFHTARIPLTGDLLARGTLTGDFAMNLDDLVSSSGEWLKGNGPESDIVISSRIRLARNLADFPFISRATDVDRAEIE